MQRRTTQVPTPSRDRFHDAETGFEGWRLRVPRPRGRRRGIPTPAVAEGRVLFGGGFGSHEFYAVDAATGRLDWGLRTSDDGPTAAVVDEGLAAFNTESCTLEVVEVASGSVLWSRWLGDPLLAQPTFARGRVLMVYPSQGRHWIQAFAGRTGAELWRAPLGHDVITAPVAVGDRVYLSTFDGAVHCFDLEEGRGLWSRPMRATSAPWVHDGRVYVAQRTDGGRAGPRSRRPDTKHPGRGPAPSERSAPGEHAPMERTGRLDAELGEGEDGFAAKEAPYLSRAWGADVKRAYHAEDASVGFAQAPVAAKIAAVQDLVGEGGVARAWRFQGSRPVVSDGILFESTGDRLEAHDLESDRTLWSWRAARGLSGERRLTPPAAANGRVLAGSWDGRLLSWDARTGELRWEIPVGSPCHWQPVMSGGWVYAGLEDGSLLGFWTGDPGDDGWPMWGGGPGHNGQREGNPARR